MPPFVDRTDFLSFALFAKNVAIDLKCIENHGGKLHSQQRAATGAPSEIVKESFALLQLSAPGVRFSNFETNNLFFSSISRTKRLHM